MKKKNVIQFPAGGGSELLGGLFEFPQNVLIGGKEERPLVYLWLELPDQLLLDASVHHKLEPVTVEQSLRQALASPVRSGRAPSRIRVADPAMAAEIEAIEGMPPVTVAPTPELDEVFSKLSSSIGANPIQSYLQRGNVREASVAEMFDAAREFLRARPWRIAGETQLIRVDLPDHPEMCALIGREGRGGMLLIFRSIEVFEWMMTTSPEDQDSRAPLEISEEPASWTLSFEKRRELVETMVAEIEEHQWPVEKNACPVVMCIDSFGEPWLPTDHDMRLVAAVTSAVTRFVRHHARIFDEEELEIASATYGPRGEYEVTVSAPFLEDEIPGDDLDSHPLEVGEPSTPDVGRNDPCPCGSGKKYKKCHLRANERSRTRIVDDEEDIWEMNHRLMEDVVAFADQELETLPDLPDAVVYDETALPLLSSWVAWEGTFAGRPYADLYLEKSAMRAREREWIESQLAAYVSAWEVLDVRGDQIELIDAFTGERRTVTDRKAGPELRRNALLLCRVSSWKDRFLFSGLHLRMLPPMEAERFTAAIRRKFRWGRGKVSPDRLSDPSVGLRMIEVWSDQIRRIDEARLKPSKLTNTDGHPLLGVTDIFTFDPADADDVETAIAGMEGADPRFDLPHDRLWYAMVRTDDTVIANIGIGRADLFVETNSKKRGTAMRRRLEKLLGSRIRFVTRRIQEPNMHPSTGSPRSGEPMSEDDRLAAMRELKERYYAEWIDEPIPALGGKTPRQAAKRAGSRRELETLLRQMEFDEERLPEEARFDMNRLRRDLGL